MKFQDKNEIKNYLENLDGFEGYVQISNRKFEKKDLFINKKIEIDDENGFIIEGAFYKDNKSIMVSFVNGEWIVSEYDIKDDETDIFLSKIEGSNLKIKMAKIFEEIEEEISDVNGENKETIKTTILKAVVFAGFKGE